jgi:PAS domain S-box-containing protein
VREFLGYVATIGKLFWVLVAEIDLVFVIGLILAWRFYDKSQVYVEKKQALLIMIGISVPLIIGSITDGLLPILGVQSPRSVVTASVFMVAFFTYANIRYGLINPTPPMAAKSMANAMSDSLILLSPRFTIELVNPATASLLGYGENELTDKPLGVLVGDKVSRQLQRAVENQEDLSRVELAYKPKTGSIIPMKLSFSTLEDKDGRGLLGVVIIGREARQEQAIIEGLNQEIRDSESEIKKLERRRDNYEKKLIDMGLIDTGFERGDERIQY